jgi:SAM-dependent methyltransferase
MCHASCTEFVRSAITSEDVEGRTVLEVGSHSVNGTTRGYLEALKPGSYIGVDIEEGTGVDEVVDVCDLAERFGPDAFDLVVSTEMLEHVRDWRGAVQNMKTVLRPGGKLVATTRSHGFPYHGHPHDYWRYEVDDFARIFEDMDIVTLVPDPSPAYPGVFLSARKVAGASTSLDDVELWSIVGRRREREIDDRDLTRVLRRKAVRKAAVGVVPMSIRRKVRG